MTDSFVYIYVLYVHIEPKRNGIESDKMPFAAANFLSLSTSDSFRIWLNAHLRSTNWMYLFVDSVGCGWLSEWGQRCLIAPVWSTSTFDGGRLMWWQRPTDSNEHRTIKHAYYIYQYNNILINMPNDHQKRIVLQGNNEANEVIGMNWDASQQSGLCQTYIHQPTSITLSKNKTEQKIIPATPSNNQK